MAELLADSIRNMSSSKTSPSPVVRFDESKPFNVKWIPPEPYSQAAESDLKGRSLDYKLSPSKGIKRKAASVEGTEIPSAAVSSTVSGRPTESPSPRKEAPDNPPSHSPLLPTPLPSKRLRRDPLRKGALLPIERIPPFPLPPLPIIHDEAILKQVFTHQSLFSNKKGHFEYPDDDLPKHYEKLEHVGDSLLGMVVTTWLHEIKPGLTPGTATQLKAHLVSNATLSHISGMYGLPQRINADPNLIPLLRVTTDVRAALLEAYIAGVYAQFPISERGTKGLSIITEWLREMYDPLLDFFYGHMRNEHDQHTNAIGADMEGNVITISGAERVHIDERAKGMWTLLRMHAKAYDRDLRFDETRYDTEVGQLFRLKCLVDGMELGEATRAGRNQAREVAAWEAAKKLGLAEE